MLRFSNSMATMEHQECVQNQIRSFIVLDLETTGLPVDKPVKITEIAVIAALREDILGNGRNTEEISVPRVLSKLTMCVSPRRNISRGAADMTHLTNELLEHQSPFDETLFIVLDGFMKRMPHPVCIIAHNGLGFDFRVLQAELHRIGKALPDHVMCADSLPGFQKLLPAKECVDAHNGQPTDVGPNGLLTGIQPQNDDHVFQDQRATKKTCSELNGLTSELEESDLHSNDYDEALCSAVDSVERFFVSQSNGRDNVMDGYFDDADDMLCCIAADCVEGGIVKGEYKVVISGSPERVKERSSVGNEVSVRQKVLEKTPPQLGARGRYPCPAGGGCSDITPQAETAGNVAGTGHNLNNFSRARKRLPFSSNKSQNSRMSYALKSVYKFLLKKEPENSHCAESDALNLLECIVALGQSFTDWVDVNAVQFNSIKKMD